MPRGKTPFLEVAQSLLTRNSAVMKHLQEFAAGVRSVGYDKRGVSEFVEKLVE